MNIQIELMARALSHIQEQDAELAAVRADIARLREALRTIAAPMRPDGSYNRDREACGILAREAIGTKPAPTQP